MLIFLSIFLVHFVWLFYSTDYKYGLHDIKIKLPLLVFPIILSSIEPFGIRQRKILFSFFMLALLASTVIGIFILLGFTRKTVSDAREISVFISHIRLSLMLNLAVFSGIWIIMSEGKTFFQREKVVYFFLIIILSAFIFILKSLTGIVVFLFLLVFALIWLALHAKNRKAKYVLIISVILVPLILVGYSTYCITKFYRVDTINFSSLEKKTISGHYYSHNLQSKEIENGHYVWLNLCEDELKNGWNSRSRLVYDGKDLKGQEIKYTLIRYLTSKGLRKDSTGVRMLGEGDVKLIESGTANYIYGNKWKLYPYIYRVLWEIRAYRLGGSPAGHSVTQRWLYLNISKDIIRQHFWLGVGTGDVQKEFNKIYETKYNYIPVQWRRRAHNQFVTFWISFGIIGFSIILFAFFFPVFARIKSASYLGYIFILIAILSMLNEDTLETQAGATFIAFFYSLFFVMANPESQSKEIH